MNPIPYTSLPLEQRAKITEIADLLRQIDIHNSSIAQHVESGHPERAALYHQEVTKLRIRLYELLEPTISEQVDLAYGAHPLTPCAWCADLPVRCDECPANTEPPFEIHWDAIDEIPF